MNLELTNISTPLLPTISFNDVETGEIIGKFFVEDNKLHFEGNVAKSAELFVAALIKQYDSKTCRCESKIHKSEHTTFRKFNTDSGITKED